MKQYTPMIIGGAGGSGTRLIAQILIDIGYYMGDKLNESMDNMWFMLLFKRVNGLNLSDNEFEQTLNILMTAMCKKGSLSSKQIELVLEISKLERGFYSQRGFKLLADSIINNVNSKDIEKWGWKEPNSHFYIQQLHKSLPKMKYIHVIRNGLDMAFSDNQNQLRLWGSQYFDGEFKVEPSTSLKFWCIIHKNILKFSQSMKGNFYLLNFDEFCCNPKNGIKKLSQYLQVTLSKEQEQNILSLVKPLKSKGRYKKQDLSIFDQKDLAYVKQLGFETEQ